MNNIVSHDVYSKRRHNQSPVSCLRNSPCKVIQA